MPCDCSATGCREIFDADQARADARRYRRRGLDRRARRLLAAIEGATPLRGATLLEVGAGIGALSLELLKRGAGSAATVDASPDAVAESLVLAEESDLAARFEPRVGNFAEDGAGERRFDVVVLDRVVCCYPVWEELLAPAAASAHRLVALTYPRDAAWMRAAARLANLGMALLRRRFRFHVHPPAAMHALLRRAGFTPRTVGHVGAWELLVASRSTPA